MVAHRAQSQEDGPLIVAASLVMLDVPYVQLSVSLSSKNSAYMVALEFDAKSRLIGLEGHRCNTMSRLPPPAKAKLTLLHVCGHLTTTGPITEPPSQERASVRKIPIAAANRCHPPHMIRVLSLGYQLPIRLASAPPLPPPARPLHHPPPMRALSPISPPPS